MYAVVRALISNYGFPDMEVRVVDTMMDAVKVLGEWWEEDMDDYDEAIERESWLEADKAFIELLGDEGVYFEVVKVTE